MGVLLFLAVIPCGGKRRGESGGTDFPTTPRPGARVVVGWSNRALAVILLDNAASLHALGVDVGAAPRDDDCLRGADRRRPRDGSHADAARARPPRQGGPES